MSARYLAFVSDITGRAIAVALVLIALSIAAVTPALANDDGLVPPALDASLDGEPTQVLVLGTSHFSSWPELERSWIDPVNEKLIDWKPDLVLIERLPGWQVELFHSQPDRFEGLLGRTHGSRIEFSRQAQELLGLSVFEAGKELEALLAQDTISADDRLRISLLELARYETESASLNWSRVPSAQKAQVPAQIAEHLTRILDAKNETIWMAVAIAEALGHDRIFSFDDQIDKDALNNSGIFERMDESGALETFFADPAIAALRAAQEGRPADPEGVMDWFAFVNSDAFAKLDIEGQWVSFMRTPSDGLGRHRVAIWEARNLRMVANAREQIARAPGGKVLIIVGSAHKPWMEAYLRLQSDVTLASFEEVFEGE